MATVESEERGTWWPIIIAAAVAVGALYLIRGILPPIVLAGIMAYLLNPIVDIGERHSLPRWAAISIIYVLMGALLAVSAIFLIPAFVHQIQEIEQQFKAVWPKLPVYLNATVAWFGQRFPRATAILVDDPQVGERMVAGVQNYMTGALARAPQYLTSVVSNVANFLLYFVMVPFIAFFLMRDGQTFRSGLISLVPNRYFETTLNVMGGVGESVGRYLRGLLIQASIMIAVSTTGLAVVGLKYAVLVGLIAGIANVIPYIGPAIGIVAGLLIVLTTGTGGVIGVLIVFGIAQFVDNWFVAPVVMSRSVELHPLTVFLAVILGGAYAGTLGMFLAIPVAGAAVVTVKKLREGLRPPVYVGLQEVPA